ncbi:Hsp20/alpha crystallin family protein [bacterium]|nr:Hsp20/alpha crystallin family protein [bacterium]
MNNQNKIIDTNNLKENKWLENDKREGQLAIDVYETEKNIIIKSTIAGVEPENLNISLSNDMLTIKGKRDIVFNEIMNEDTCLYQECYWGPFSRSVILPTEIDESNIDAVLENGVLTITLSKIEKAEKIEVRIK